MNQTVETLLERNLHGIFGERDSTRRRATLNEIWAVNGVFVDHNGAFRGHYAIDQAVAELHDRFPEFVFSVLRPPEVMQGVGRVAWGFGPRDAPPIVMGTDVLVTHDGRIEALYVFLDESSK